jgi:hypoxanthine-DNA glycosylase
MKIYSFPPIQANNAKVLILGTMPSVQSLLHNQYYGNKQNSFWQLMFAVFEQPFTNDYGAKTRLLLANKICLWDVLQACERKGSSDNDIKYKVANDIAGLLAKNKSITTICFNGKNAEKYFQKLIGTIKGINQVVLPSTSPANTWLNYSAKLKQWSVVKTLVSV